MKTSVVYVLFLFHVIPDFTVSFETWDCGKQDKSMDINYADIKPDPVIYPGNVSISVNITVLRDLPDSNLILSLLLEKLEPFPMKVPCFQNMGSCSYDVCKEVIPKNQEAFCALDACQCPLKAKEYCNKTPIQYQLPLLKGKILKKILEGKYTGNITFWNKETSVVYGCLGMNFDIKASDSNFLTIE